MARNPKLFRELSEPFNTVEEANTAIKGFLEGLGRLREEFKIPNVLTVVNLSFLDKQGDEAETMICNMFGDSGREEGLAACAYGEARKTREQWVATLLAGKGGKPL